MKKSNFSNDEKKAIGIRIRNIRINLKKNMEQFGELFNEDKPIAQSIVSRWERGISIPSSGRLNQIAELGNVSVDYLLEGKTPLRYIDLMSDTERKEYLSQSSNSIKYDALQYMSKKYNTLEDFETYKEAMLLNEVFSFIDNYMVKNNISAISDLTRVISVLNVLHGEFSIPTFTDGAEDELIHYHENKFKERSNKLYKDVTDILKDKLKPE